MSTLELFHEISDPDSATVRRVITAAGVWSPVKMRNVHYDEHKAALPSHARVPSIFDGERWHVGKDAVIARVLLVPPELRTDRLLLRHASAADAAALTTLHADASVRAFWPEFDLDTPDDTQFAIEHEGAVIGYAHYDENDDPEFRSAGIDLWLGARWQRQGFGREAIRALTGYLIDARGHHRLTVDPVAHNTRAIAAYEAVGFKRVGVLRQYQRLDGSWRDGLLMDLLASDR